MNLPPSTNTQMNETETSTGEFIDDSASSVTDGGAAIDTAAATPEAPGRFDAAVTNDSQGDTDATPLDDDDEQRPPTARRPRHHLIASVVIPLLLMGMALGAGYLKYRDGSIRGAHAAAISSVHAATEGTIALLSYNPDTAQGTLTAAADRLTGTFRDSYVSLITDVVIPGAKDKKISATATVPAAASVMANESHAVVLVFVDQSVVVGDDAPSATASAVQVTLDKDGSRWLISGFDPK